MMRPVTFVAHNFFSLEIYLSNTIHSNCSAVTCGKIIMLKHIFDFREVVVSMNLSWKLFLTKELTLIRKTGLLCSTS